MSRGRSIGGLPKTDNDKNVVSWVSAGQLVILQEFGQPSPWDDELGGCKSSSTEVQTCKWLTREIVAQNHWDPHPAPTTRMYVDQNPKPGVFENKMGETFALPLSILCICLFCPQINQKKAQSSCLPVYSIIWYLTSFSFDCSGKENLLQTYWKEKQRMMDNRLN